MLKRWKLFIGLFALVYSWFVSSADANQYECDDLKGISIIAPDKTMVEHVCVAAERAFSFLKEYDLTPKRSIKLEIIDKAVNLRGYKAYGSYYRQGDQIFMMSLPAILESIPEPRMYNMPFDDEHYLGAIAHEISHAIFNQNAIEIEEKWNNAAQEYLAHATQLGVLLKERRAQIIAMEGIEAWQTGDEISVTYMAFNPTGFAVKSYLHLRELDDPKKFIQILLNHKWLYVSVP